MPLWDTDSLYGHGFFAACFWIGLTSPMLALAIASWIRRRNRNHPPAPNNSASTSKVLVYYLITGPLALFLFFGIKKSCIDIPFFALLIAGVVLGISILQDALQKY